MKRSDMLSKIASVIINYNEVGRVTSREKALEMAKTILDMQENFMTPKQYVNPKAMEEFGDVIKEKGKTWGYIHYIDKYPEHHFLKGRPYEYYLKGWEPEMSASEALDKFLTETGWDD